jgi:hypothetical protein
MSIFFGSIASINAQRFYMFDPGFVFGVKKNRNNFEVNFSNYPGFTNCCG